MDFTFQSWLNKQEQRRDQVGRLARLVVNANYKYVERKRKRDEHKKWASIITKIGEQEHIFAFNTAWQEYTEEKQAVTA